MHGNNRSSAPPAPPVVAPPVVHPSCEDVDQPPAPSTKPHWTRLPIEAFVAITCLFVGVCIGAISTRNPSETALNSAGLVDPLSLAHEPIQQVGLEALNHQDAGLSASDLATRSNVDLGMEIATPALESVRDSTDAAEMTQRLSEGPASVPIEQAAAEATQRSIATRDSGLEDDWQFKPRRASATESPFVVVPEANDATKSDLKVNANNEPFSLDRLPLAADLLAKPLQDRMSVLESALKVALPSKVSSEKETAGVQPSSSPSAVCEDGKCTESMKSHGTELHWAESPAAAYQMAGVQNKLVFLIHVSGNFEIPGFT